jgi:hypothetical protein
MWKIIQASIIVRFIMYDVVSTNSFIEFAETRIGKGSFNE